MPRPIADEAPSGFTRDHHCVSPIGWTYEEWSNAPRCDVIYCSHTPQSVPDGYAYFDRVHDRFCIYKVSR